MMHMSWIVSKSLQSEVTVKYIFVYDAHVMDSKHSFTILSYQGFEIATGCMNFNSEILSVLYHVGSSDKLLKIKLFSKSQTAVKITAGRDCNVL